MEDIIFYTNFSLPRGLVQQHVAVFFKKNVLKAARIV